MEKINGKREKQRDEIIDEWIEIKKLKDAGKISYDTFNTKVSGLVGLLYIESDRTTRLMNKILDEAYPYTRTERNK